MEYKYFENEGAYYRMRDTPGTAWIDDIWTPDGWKPYKGDAAARYWSATPISAEQVPKFRESLLARLARDIEERDKRDFALAIDLARRLHDKETFEHVERVVDRVRADPFAMIVAALHDSVEDTPLTVAVIKRLFGWGIGVAVDAITRRKDENYLTDYIPRVAANEMARIVKLADLDDHLDPAQAATLKPDKKERYERAREVLLAPRPVSGGAFQILAAPPKSKTPKPS